MQALFRHVYIELLMRPILLLKYPPCRPIPRLRHWRVQAYRTFTSSLSRIQRLEPLITLPAADLSTFRDLAFSPEVPYRFPERQFRELLPAVHKWFKPPSSSRQQECSPKCNEQPGETGQREDAGSDGNADEGSSLDIEYLARFGSTVVPMELFFHDATPAYSTLGANSPQAPSASNQESVPPFQRLEAPLSHFLTLHQMQIRADPSTPSPQVYIAQAPLESLPQELQADLPTPELVLKAGQGDMYDSNIWLGAAPTYTPLHKDPNPNLFAQLAGRKLIRVFAPDVGRELFQEAAKVSGLQEGSEEMMSGEGRQILEDVVWGQMMKQEGSKLGHEASLEPGDAVFVPKGWWHSIKGVGGGVVGSVNWWFR